MKKLLLILISTIFLSPAGFAQKKKNETKLKDWSTYNLSENLNLKVPGKISKEIAANKRVYIAGLILNQATLTTATQMGASNFAKMTVNFGGVEQSAYQQLASKLYDNLVTQFKAQGYEVVSNEEVAKSAFAQANNNGKNEFCALTTATPREFDDTRTKTDYAAITPEGKFFCYTTKTLPGMFYDKLSKDLNANVIFLNYYINFVGIDGSRSVGRASIEAAPYLTVYPQAFISTPKGPAYSMAKAIEGNNNWVGPDVITKTDGSKTVFGSKKGTYVMDIDQNTYLNEVGALLGQLNNTAVTTMLAQGK